jgi:HAMP domain-containing protein
MPRILAIDWDRLEARALVLHAGATGSSIVGAWAVPLAAEDGGGSTGKQLSAKLSAALAGEVSGRMTTIIGVGREQVQMVLLSLPPAPPDELPEMVRFQAERELTSLGPGAALDFIPLSGDATTPHQVLVAALAAHGIAEVNDVCTALDLEPERITLRATAAASFVARSLAAGRDEVTLVANRLTDEADLTVLVGDQVVLVRTVRLPDASDAATRQRALAGEIRRTVASVRQQLGEEQVGRVVLCGNASEAAEASALGDDLKLPVEMFDVAEHAPAGIARASLSKESLARFAAVLGMALGEADRRPPVLDFLHVRRRTETTKFTRTHALAAAAAAVVLLAFALMLWRQAAAPARELASVNTELASVQTQIAQYQTVLDEANAIESWLATDVNWLDKLERFSLLWRPLPLDAKEFPSAQDAVVTQLTVFRPPGRDVQGGRATVQAVARSAAAVAPIESRLRDKAHRVSVGGGKIDRAVPGYGWSFGLVMDVPPASEADSADDSAEAGEVTEASDP